MLTADYFDGQSTRVRVVNLQADGRYLDIAGEDIERHIPFSEVKVDERLVRAPRRLHFSDGAFCTVRDLSALDALLSSVDHRDGWVDRAQRRARSVLVSLWAVAVLAVAGYLWLLPWAAARAAAKVPAVVGHRLSVETLRALDGNVLLPSLIPQDRQRALSAKVQALLLPGGGAPAGELLFRRSPQLGANAFTLPDGTIVVLDDLINVIDDDREIVAVVAHELGHAHGHHALQLLLQGSIAGTFLAFYVGDVSSLLAVAPTAIVHASYSRELETQADEYAAAVLRLNGMSPTSLAEALKKLADFHRGGGALGYLSTHPAVEERIRHLRDMSR
jgi:Zn-dependent protease with chaperone function